MKIIPDDQNTAPLLVPHHQRMAVVNATKPQQPQALMVVVENSNISNTAAVFSNADINLF